jgi:trigger factor
MNISQEKTGDLTATLKIEVAASDYKEQFDTELKKYRKQATLPGFRPGKVPMGVIQKKYGTALKVEEVNKVVSGALNDYITNEKLDLLGYPISNPEKGVMPDFENQNDFEFYFDIATAPEITIDISENTEAEYLKILISDEMLDRFIDDIRKRNGAFEEVDDIEESDMVTVKVEELNEDNTVNTEGISNSAPIVPTYIKDEDTRAELLKLKVGDTIIFNPLTATGNATETATMLGIKKEEAENLQSNFQFTVEKITRQGLADVDEELYKATFPNDEIKDETEFREKVREEASKAHAAESDKYFMHHTMEQFLDKTEIALPDEFLKKWLYVSNEGKTSEAEIEKDYHHYQRSMKMQLVENRMIKANEGLRVTEKDIKDQIRSYFSMYMPPHSGDDTQEWDKRMDGIVDNYMQNKEEVQKISNQIFDQRLIELFKSKLNVVEKEVSYDEFVKTINESHQHDHDHADEHAHLHEEENSDEQ